MEITEGAGISLGTAAGERGELGQLWVRCSGCTGSFASRNRDGCKGLREGGVSQQEKVMEEEVKLGFEELKGAQSAEKGRI